MQSSETSEMKLRSNANLSSVVNGIQLETILQRKCYTGTWIDLLSRWKLFSRAVSEKEQKKMCENILATTWAAVVL